MTERAAAEEVNHRGLLARSAAVADLGVRPHPPWRPSEKFMVYQFRKQ